MKRLKTLYGVDKKGEAKQWAVWSQEGSVFVEHGKVGGKLQVRETKCVPKNVGRANETTSEQQADAEAQSKWTKQYKKFYRETIEEAREILTEGVMLAQDYTKKPHYLEDEFYASPKLDGLRVKSIYTQGMKAPIWLSRGGETYPVPSHLVDGLKALHERTELPMIDGEGYIHGIKLQNTQSCIKKPKELTKQVKFCVFDIPILGKKWEERWEMLKTMQLVISSYDIKDIIIIPQNKICKNQLEDELQFWLNLGYEGLMLRNPNGEYLFQNKRSNDLLKYKVMHDSEAKVIGMRKDKNDEAVLTCRWHNDITFELKMIGDHAYREFENQKQLLGKWINFKYQDTTEDGLPTFAVGQYVRECDQEGNPIE